MRLRPFGLSVICVLVPVAAVAQGPVDLGRYDPDCGVEVRVEGERLRVSWAAGEGVLGHAVLNHVDGRPVFAELGLRGASSESPAILLRDVEPTTFLVVGTRQPPPNRPPTLSPFSVFFDSPSQRPHEAYRSRLERRGPARVSSEGRRATIALGDVALGPFTGELRVTFYANTALIRVETVVSTQEDRRAITYDAGLVSESPGWRRVTWKGPRGRVDSRSADAPDVALAVMHRAIAVESDQGSAALFPPPHQYFFPRDYTDNLKTVWAGRDHRGLEPRSGFGIRQAEDGGGRFSPWHNAPPDTEQHLGFFLVLSRGTARDALDDALRYTNGDRFPALAGHVTFTSHWHMATAVAAMKEIAAGRGRTVPEFVGMFKDMNVQIVHLAEFHGDGHPQDPGPVRVGEMEAMFEECRRLSDDELVLLPGEEANAYLGIARAGQHPGHWVYLFPRPVLWVMKRAPGEPFSEPHAKYGTLYRVGDRADMLRLLEIEHGLAWTAHARIKASSWAPDAYRDEDFFRSDRWLGAAWKSMPTDLSRPKLGERALDLLDDMANWGQRKYVLGEVDVFKLNATHELYGHMNVNYLKLDRLPRYEEGWQPVLDALRAGRFFVTTGEVLIEGFSIGGRESGETLKPAAGERPELKAALRWTFPLEFAEVVSGDGTKTYRERIELTDTSAFGRKDLALRPTLDGRRWARLEAWDVAGNGAFTQPIWIEAQP